MSLVTESDARGAAKRAASQHGYQTHERILREEAQSRNDKFDVFLSHSIRDAELIVGALQLLREAGKTVYVDWIVDPQLSRESVTAKTAEKLRSRMRQCSALVYLHTSSSTKSRWMPWELGYFDGHNGNVAIFPIVSAGQGAFLGEEFLGMYPYIDLSGQMGRQTIWIHRSSSEYKQFDNWRTGTEKLKPSA